MSHIISCYFFNLTRHNLLEIMLRLQFRASKCKWTKNLNVFKILFRSSNLNQCLCIFKTHFQFTCFAKKIFFHMINTMSCHTETKCLKNSKTTLKINKLDFVYSQKVTQIEPLANLTCSIYMLCLTQFLEFNFNSYNFEKETNSNCIFINLPQQCQTKTNKK